MIAVKQPPGPADHAVAPAVGQPPREHLEHATPLGRAVTQRRAKHGELVTVGEQSSRHACHHKRMPETLTPQREALREQESDELASTDRPWVTVVWNDPINLMSYVTHVFMTVFGYPKPKAEKLMLDVHHRGRAVVSSGTRERMELDVTTLHGYGLWATLSTTAERLVKFRRRRGVPQLQLDGWRRRCWAPCWTTSSTLCGTLAETTRCVNGCSPMATGTTRRPRRSSAS